MNYNMLFHRLDEISTRSRRKGLTFHYVVKDNELSILFTSLFNGYVAVELDNYSAVSHLIFLVESMLY